MLIGLLIATVIGCGVRPTVGLGLVMNRGAGRRITTDDGSITTIAGLGVRAVATTTIEVGGAQRSSPSISHSATITAGIRLITTSAIHTLGITGVLLQSD